MGKEPISRVFRTRAEARASYDWMSRWYDWLSGPSENKYKETGLSQLNVLGGEIVLEIGFGTGHCLKILAQGVGLSGKVFGIDLSEGMIHEAQEKLVQVELAERVELICGDAVHLPYRDNCFDALFMSFTLELFDTPEIPIVLQECWRVLRPDGRICIVALAKKEASNLAVRIYEWFHEKFTKYVDCRPIYTQAVAAAAGFQIKRLTEMSLFQLPVDIVLAKKV